MDGIQHPPTSHFAARGSAPLHLSCKNVTLSCVLYIPLNYVFISALLLLFAAPFAGPRGYVAPTVSYFGRTANRALKGKRHPRKGRQIGTRFRFRALARKTGQDGLRPCAGERAGAGAGAGFCCGRCWGAHTTEVDGGMSRAAAGECSITSPMMMQVEKQGVIGGHCAGRPLLGSLEEKLRGQMEGMLGRIPGMDNR